MTLEYYILNFGPYFVIAVGVLSGAILVFARGKTKEEATKNLIERSRDIGTGETPKIVKELKQKD